MKIKCINNIFKICLFVIFANFCYAHAASEGKIFGQVMLNPYGNAPLSAILPLKHADIAHASVKVAGIGPGAKDFSYQVGPQSLLEHDGVPIFGLYSGAKNRVEVRINYCQMGSCKELIKNLEIQTPNIQISATSRQFRSLHDDTFVLFSRKNGPSFAIDARGKLRWFYKHSGQLLAQTPSGKLLIEDGALLRKIDLIGRHESSLSLSDSATALSIDHLGRYLYATKHCSAGVCAPFIYSAHPASGQLFRLSLEQIFSPLKSEFSSAASEQKTTLLLPSQISADADGIVLSLPKYSAIAKINFRGEIIWLLSAKNGWHKAHQRKILRMLNTKYQRLNCDDFACTDAISGAVFSYPHEPTSVKVLGRKGGNLYIAVFERTANERAKARIFEIDERRLSAREIWHFLQENTPKNGYISGDLSHVSVFSSGNKMAIYSYSFDAPMQTESSSKIVDFNADFSQRKEGSKANSIEFWLRLQPSQELEQPAASANASEPIAQIASSAADSKPVMDMAIELLVPFYR